MSPTLDSGWILWLFEPTEYGRCEGVPLSRSKIWETSKFYFLSLQTHTCSPGQLGRSWETTCRERKNRDQLSSQGAGHKSDALLDPPDYLNLSTEHHWVTGWVFCWTEESFSWTWGWSTQLQLSPSSQSPRWRGNKIVVIWSH